jgi:beta-lactamase class A
MKTIFIILHLFTGITMSQNLTVPSYYSLDENLSYELNKIAADLEIDKDFDVGEDGIEQISLAVIKLNGNKPKLGEVNFDNFIYPASVYKMYAAAEVLNQISEGKYSLETVIEVKSPNDVDRSKEIESDPRPLLKDGDSVTVNYLLDLMITRSDNSAANCIIDLADRKNINALIQKYNWNGSEVTRKFLSRKFEDPGYEKIRGTETCALHAADFLYLIYTNQLVNPWVSMQLKTYLGRQLDNTKLQTGLPNDAMFYHKTGWFSYWTHDVGIVDNGETKYIIACFLPIPEVEALPILKLLGERIHQLMKTKF